MVTLWLHTTDSTISLPSIQNLQSYERQQFKFYTGEETHHDILYVCTRPSNMASRDVYWHFGCASLPVSLETFGCLLTLSCISIEV